VTWNDIRTATETAFLSTFWSSNKGGRVQGVTRRTVSRDGSLSEKTPARVNDTYVFHYSFDLSSGRVPLGHAPCR
jgi:hypothetical protein